MQAIREQSLAFASSFMVLTAAFAAACDAWVSCSVRSGSPCLGASVAKIVGAIAA